MFINEKELIQLNTNHTSPNGNILPVIMCTWKREEGFLKVIQHLNNQNFQNFHLFVWNNNQEKKDQFQTILEKNAKFSSSIIHSKENIGGFGRFFLARHLLNMENRMDFCVFIDDDQAFDEDSLDIFLSEANKKEISSQWAWKIKTLNYYGAANRIKVHGGELVDYCGTGGMVCDMDIFEQEELFKCPEKYWFIEDLWLSFFSNHYHGYKLKKSSAKFKNGSDEHNLFDKIKHLKSPMLKDLVENYGWKITYNQ